MAFQVPASKASIGQDQFTFGPEAGDEFSVKKARFCAVGTVEKVMSGTSVGLDFFGAAGTKSGDYVRSLDMEQYGALLEAWNADSGLTSGESEAS